jgi:hypothetical protein
VVSLVVLEHSHDPHSDHHIRCYPPEERAGVALHCLRADYPRTT